MKRCYKLAQVNWTFNIVQGLKLTHCLAVHSSDVGTVQTQCKSDIPPPQTMKLLKLSFWTSAH